MNYLIKTARVFYAIALVVYGLQQFYFGTFRNVFVSAYQNYLPLLNIMSYLFGLYLIGTAILIITEKKGKQASLLLAGLLLFLFLTTQLTYQFFSEPNKIYHLGLWVNQLKELALCGGAFVLAGSFCYDVSSNSFYHFLSKWIPYGNLFFLFTMTSFGISHLIYGPFLVNIVPDWCPDHLFWVYFTGVALIGAGVTLMLGFRIRVISLLLGIMTFLWVWMVHIPAGIKRPVFNRGDLLASGFDALAFSGISLLIAFTMREQAWVSKIENWANAKSSKPEPEKKRNIDTIAQAKTMF